MVRREDWAEPSLAARREERRLGIAMAAMMPMIATTMSSSINEKPFWFLLVISFICSLRDKLVCLWFPFGATGLVSNEQPQRAICHAGLSQRPCQRNELIEQDENLTKS